MRILFLTYFFPPDLSAGSFRAKALVDELLRCGPRNLQIDIISTIPNRYVSHVPEDEVDTDTVGREERVHLTRVTLPRVRRGFSGQVRSFFRYALFVRSYIKKNKQYDVVFSTTSRLMTGFLGAYSANVLGSALYLDIRDIFTETIEDVFPGVWLAPVRSIFRYIERKSVSRADRINLVSKGFLPYFQERYSRDDYRFFTNGVDSEFLELATHPEFQRLKNNASQDRKKVEILYAGNIGDGQGLERIVPELACRISEFANFTIVGDGNTFTKLVRECEAKSAPVTFHKAVPRSEIIEHYERADVLFLHLNDLPAFTRVLPSKVFEYAATGKPILAGVSGYAETFIKENVRGSAVFPPCNISKAEQAFKAISVHTVDRSAFVGRFSRNAIMKRMARDVLDMRIT